MSEVSKPWPSQGDLTALVEKSAGLFIYPLLLSCSLTIKMHFPTSGSKWFVTHEATTISIDWYMQILSACSNLDHLKLVIGAIILVRMPLSPRGLSYLLEMKLGACSWCWRGLHSILSIPADPDKGVVTPFISRCAIFSSVKTVLDHTSSTLP